MRLEKLLESIVEHQPEDYLLYKLDNYGFTIQSEKSLNTDQALKDELREKLRRLSSEFSPYDLMQELCLRPNLINMILQADSAGPSSEVLQKMSSAELYEFALESFEIPRITLDPGIGRIRRKLIHIRDQIDRSVSLLRRSKGKSKNEPERLRGLNVNSWTYLEKTLKQVLGFYAFHFSKFDKVTDELRAAFASIGRVKKDPMGPVLDSFQKIEFIFQHGESQSQQRKRDKALKDEIDKAYREIAETDKALRVVERAIYETDQRLKVCQGIEEEIRHQKEEKEFLIDKAESLKHRRESLLDQEDELRRMAQEKSRITDQRGLELACRLKKECEHSFGRPSPFCSVPFDKAHEFRQKYRNPNAHHTIEELMKDDPTGAKAKQSVQSAIELVDYLIDNSIAPQMIFLIGEGYDAYGERILFYVREESIDEEDLDRTKGYVHLPCKARYLYNRNLVFEPLAACLVIERQNEDSCYEPPAYHYEQVEAAIQR